MMATVAPHSPDDDLAARKARLRRHAKLQRALIPADRRAAASHRLRGALLAFLGRHRGRALAGFWPLGGEVDLVPLLHAWHDAGGVALLPRVEGPGRPLRFLRWTPGTVLQASGFGVDEPPPEACEHRPDIVLVPLLAVDRRGYRVGYGGGYYDRTLADLGAVTAIGVAFDVQRVDEVPRGPYDMPLTHLATESGIMTFQRDFGA